MAYVYEFVLEVVSSLRVVETIYDLNYKYDYVCKDMNLFEKHLGIKVINSGVELYFDDKLGLVITQDSVLSQDKEVLTAVLKEMWRA
jgi:hypothetical protein